jgi:hypothetical protein
MNDVNEMWSSPWRKLQKNLASGFAIEESNSWICDSRSPGSAQVSGSAQVLGSAVHSWLVRARCPGR